MPTMWRRGVSNATAPDGGAATISGPTLPIISVWRTGVSATKGGGVKCTDPDCRVCGEPLPEDVLAQRINAALSKHSERSRLERVFTVIAVICVLVKEVA